MYRKEHQEEEVQRELQRIRERMNWERGFSGKRVGWGY